MIIECYATNEEIEALSKGRDQMLSNAPIKNLGLSYFKILISTNDYAIVKSSRASYIHVIKRKKQVISSGIPW